jgi:hypothetical protein
MADSAETTGQVQPEPVLLGIYLNDHLAAGTAGADLSRRAVAGLDGTPSGSALQRVATEIEEDVHALRQMMTALDVPVRRYKLYAARAAERVGRLKPSGHVRGRSPLSTLIELETLFAGVHAKMALWRSLQAIADHDGRLDAARLSGLLDRAARQAEDLEDLRISVVREVFAAR